MKLIDSAAGPVTRFALSAVRDHLCRWDYEAAQRVDSFVANSENVKVEFGGLTAERASVIYPPVDTQRFVITPRPSRRDNFFLTVSQLVPYKRIDLIVDAFNISGRPLVIVGDGPERDKARTTRRREDHSI